MPGVLDDQFPPVVPVSTRRSGETLHDSQIWSTVLLAAGAWNLTTGLAYLVLGRAIAQRLGVGTGADRSDRRLVNLVHLYFGVAAFAIANDPARDIHLIALWTATKLSSFVLACVRCFETGAPRLSRWTLVPGCIDLAWAALFVGCMVDLAGLPRPA